MKSFVRIFAAIWSVYYASAQTYSCGGATSDPVDVQGPSGSSTFSRTIAKSSALCVLVRVTAVSNAPLSNLSRYANLADYNLMPVARSYSSNNWERVGGPYAQKLTVSCSGSNCNLSIPTLSLPSSSAGANAGRFYLIAFSHSLTQQEKRARFLMQTTFGPTISSLNSFSESYENWVENQMNMSPTLHRAYFRTRVDGSVLNGDETGSGVAEVVKIRSPCEKGSRWSRAAFTSDDWIRTLTASRRDGQWLLSIDGVPRTVVSTWEDEDDDSGNSLGAGSWQFCYWGDDTLGGIIYIYAGTNECFAITNPPVNLPFSSNQVKTIALPNLGGPTETVRSPRGSGELLFGDTYYATSDVSSVQCNGFTYADYLNVIGTRNGVQYRYLGFLQLKENTVENPEPDGGGDMYEDYSNIGQFCGNPAMDFLNIDSCFMTTASQACSSRYEKEETDDAVVICGSHGEVANNEPGQHTFQYAFSTFHREDTDSARQKKSVWSMIALQIDGAGADQFRQRMAWALSQILVVTPNQINEENFSEIYLAYYDIFVRNAFGNYFQVLKEVAYSSMMAEMLSFLDSKSSSYVLMTTDSKAFPDENFAREIMQLFTIGVHKLNMDGTLLLDSSGLPIPTYDNTDIQNFARAWTGFTRQSLRSNIESVSWEDKNRIDPMRIEGPWRDSFPKMNLDGNSYIGDKVPLCVDLPKYQFLRKGAKYRLLGSSTYPHLHHQPQWWFDEGYEVTGFQLSTGSNLFSRLCNGSPGNCNFQPEITLTSNLNCIGDECNVDEIRLVRVQSNPPVFYEYLRPACVEMAFYDDGKTIAIVNGKDSMCANPNLPIARDTCCDSAGVGGSATSYCKFTNERTTFQTSSSRCAAGACAWNFISGDNSAQVCLHYMEDAYHWAGEEPCTLQAKVRDTGTVAIVHNPFITNGRITERRVRNSNSNYFKVAWTDAYPATSNNCGNGACQSFAGDCLCDVIILETQVFNRIPSLSEIENSLFVGGVNVDSFPDGTYAEGGSAGGVTVFHRGSGYSKDSVFRASYRGEVAYFKNVESMVKSGDYSFRNPPQFLNPALHEPRDAIYESDEILKAYFYHENVAPFLATRLIQRFGISNPSPRYVETVAIAFKNGSYSSGGVTFGSSNYGDLGAAAAAIVLDRESTSEILDADPTGGSLREPMLKLIAFMRALEYTRANDSPELRLYDLQGKVGQEPHQIPSVFSYFQPDYAAPGHIKAASIKSPEAQVLTAPKVTRFLNGLFSLVDNGLNDCYGGFGEELMDCGALDYDDPLVNAGELKYFDSTSKTGEALVNELAILLTGGRLNTNARSIIVNAFNAAGNNANGRKIAAKLIATTPEFHSTNVADAKTTGRPNYDVPSASNKAYKAVIFLMMDGGADSYNMLVPNSNSCSGSNGAMYDHYNSVRSGLAIPKASLLNIDASGSNQMCSNFGIHPNLPFLQKLYNGADLLWVSNLGVLQKQNTNTNNFWENTDDTELFAHNLQSDEVKNMDIYENQAGRGVGGRMADVLLQNGFKAGVVSASGLSPALVSSLASLIVVDSEGAAKLGSNPFSVLSGSIVNRIKNLNNSLNIGSGLFAETWSSILTNGIGETDLLFDALESVTLQTAFTKTNQLSRQFENVAKLIKTKDTRGTDRDVFYVEQFGFDTHDNLESDFNTLAITMNQGLEEFHGEMVKQGTWDDVVIVMVSEFARTLTENSSSGSDHAWGGHYFITGGSVEGKKILGSYPDRLDGGDLIFEPGICIPTTPWDAVWNGVAQWLGITNASDLDTVLPNRNSFNNLFSQSTLFGGSDPSPSTQAPTPASPTPPAPTPSTSCVDSPLPMKVNGKTKKCQWVAKKTNKRCNKRDVSNHCSDTCAGDCSADSAKRFKMPGGKLQTCKWVARKNTPTRCSKTGVSETCRATCANAGRNAASIFN